METVDLSKAVKGATVKFLHDPEDANFVEQYTWIISNHGYAQRRVPFKKDGKRTYQTFLFHRELMGAEAGQIVDHINGNTLDNRKSNLRICTASESVMNTRPHKDKKHSIYKGVTFHKARKKYFAQIQKGGVKRNLGYFDTPEAAAIAYNTAAKEWFGEFYRKPEHDIQVQS